MKNIKKYNIFILLSTFARNIVDIFSSVLLYKMGYSIRDIFIFYGILSLFGIFISIITIKLTNKIKIKYLLMIFNIIFSISFYYMSVTTKTFSNLIIFSVLYSIGSYGYHNIRHYLGIILLNKERKKEIGNIIIYMNIASIISSIISGYIISNLPSYILALIIIFISVLSIIPIIKLDFDNDNSKINYQKIDKNKRLFFILEQGKVVFLFFEPLFIYLYILESFKYVGITSATTLLSASLFIYFFVRKIDDKKYFKYLNLLFSLLLILKLNISNKYLMIIIVFFEGIFIKIYETISMDNLYSIKKNINIKSYLVTSESIFCLVRFLLSIIFLFTGNIKIFMYFLIVFIFISGFVKRK